MNNTLRFTLTLSIIAVVMSIAIGFTHFITRERIRQKDEAKRVEAITAVLPGVVKPVDITPHETVVENKVYKGVNKKGAVAGYAALGVAQGYNGRVKVMTGLTPDMNQISGIYIVHHEETPGLGSKIVERKRDKTLYTLFTGSKELKEKSNMPWFCKQFVGKTLNQLTIAEQEEPDGIHAITAATVSTNAVIEAVKDAITKIQVQVPEPRVSENGW